MARNALPNDILINLVQHNRIMRYCFCQVCRPLRLQRIENDATTRGEVYDRFINVLPIKIDTDLDKCFGYTLELIACGKAYKE